MLAWVTAGTRAWQGPVLGMGTAGQDAPGEGKKHSEQGGEIGALTTILHFLKVHEKIVPKQGVLNKAAAAGYGRVITLGECDRACSKLVTG